MKKILILFFLFASNVSALGNVLISKKDIDTNYYVNDSSFLFCDSDGNVIDSWIQNDSYHVVTAPKGSYKLITQPIMFDDHSFSTEYNLDIVRDETFEFILYNNEIATPENLGYNFNSTYGLIFIIIGILILFYKKYFSI